MVSLKHHRLAALQLPNERHPSVHPGIRRNSADIAQVLAHYPVAHLRPLRAICRVVGVRESQEEAQEGMDQLAYAHLRWYIRSDQLTFLFCFR